MGDRAINKRRFMLFAAIWAFMILNPTGFFVMRTTAPGTSQRGFSHVRDVPESLAVFALYECLYVIIHAIARVTDDYMLWYCFCGEDNLNTL